MSKEDIAVTPFAGVVGEMKPSNSMANKPIFYIAIEEGTGKNSKVNAYLTLKVDKHDSYVEFKGSPTLETEAGIKDPHNSFELIKTQEICVPWHRVVKIRNLSFKPTK